MDSQAAKMNGIKVHWEALKLAVFQREFKAVKPKERQVYNATTIFGNATIA